jgi:hypothetical protein
VSCRDSNLAILVYKTEVLLYRLSQLPPFLSLTRTAQRVFSGCVPLINLSVMMQACAILTLSKCLLFCFAHIVGLDVNLLLTHSYCCKVNGRHSCLIYLFMVYLTTLSEAHSIYRGSQPGGNFKVSQIERLKVLEYWSFYKLQFYRLYIIYRTSHFIGCHILNKNKDKYFTFLYVEIFHYKNNPSKCTNIEKIKDFQYYMYIIWNEPFESDNLGKLE